ncbi:MAG: D-alanyl-D-alanine carboxypeptidase [Candidatus Taylorbacteria bacterium]|nr:D-alanyl-D-alanine carboxypeptidase [Candidatus Taylorbacteria bacterium]
MKKNIYTKTILSPGFIIFISIFFFPNVIASASELITGKDTMIWPQITATSAYVYDPIGNKVLYTKNADEIRPIASLNKLMTAAVADTLLSTSPHFRKPVKIQKFTNANRADVTLKDGSLWGIEDLMTYMLVGSSNKAAETIASSMVPRESFISLMNFTARKLGLTNTTFTNPTGLTTHKTVGKTKTTIPSGHSTAREVAQMLWKIIESHPGLLEATQLAHITYSNGISAVAVDNTNKILENFPIVVGKTGFTEDAGGNLVVVLQKTPRSHAYVIVVLGSTQEGRFSDVAALASKTLQIAGER